MDVDAPVNAAELSSPCSTEQGSVRSGRIRSWRSISVMFDCRSRSVKAEANRLLISGENGTNASSLPGPEPTGKANDIPV
jgi:hypothetical protein